MTTSQRGFEAKWFELGGKVRSSFSNVVEEPRWGKFTLVHGCRNLGSGRAGIRLCSFKPPKKKLEYQDNSTSNLATTILLNQLIFAHVIYTSMLTKYWDTLSFCPQLFSYLIKNCSILHVFTFFCNAAS